MKSITVRVALATAAFVSFAAPASAGTIVMTGGSSTGGAAGNILSFNDGAGISVQASAFSIVNGVTQAAYLGAFGSGLGVTNSLEGNGSAGNSHTVDNYQATGTGFDFILLVFNKAVNLSTAVLSPFQVDMSAAADNDAFVNRGTLANAFQASPTAVSTANALAIANAAGGKNVAGNLASGNSTALNMANSYANVWVIGAARSSYTAIDNNADGFKLKSVTATAAVPEPATWGMMIGGMGIAGMALRRRRRTAVAQVIA
jgi:PEP-CTERM motif